MNLPTEHDETGRRWSQRLRQAHELLDERPSTKVRDAVLRAAAQGAAGASGHAPRPVRPGPGAWRWLSWRPPLAAGATALVGVLAIGIGLRVQQEQQAARPAAGQDQEALQPGVRQERVPSAVALPGAAAPVRPTPALTVTESSEGAAARRAAPAPAAPPTGAMVAPAPQALSLPRVMPNAAPDAVSGASRSAPSNVSPSVTTDATADATADAPRNDAAAAAHNAAAAAQARTALSAPLHNPAMGPATAVQEPLSWLKRIAQLRAAHRDDEADQELARFVEANPGQGVPDNVRRH